MDQPRRMLIFGLPKRLTPKKLKKLIARQNDSDLWELELLVPLEDSSMAQVICSTRRIYEKLAQTIFFLGRHNKNFEYHTLSLCRLRYLTLSEPAQFSEPRPFTDKDCLWKIFEWCSLKSQIALAKVCRLYHELIVSIWRSKYKTLRYNLKDFHFKEQLSPDEICDFLTVVGEFVEHLIFWCYLYIPVSTIYQVDAMTGNFLTNSKHLINRMMCRHLAYFPNLRIFEVEGKFLFDWVLRALALNCPELRVFRLLDSETRWLSAGHLWCLCNLEVCCLKDGKELPRRLVAKLCRRAKNLHTLDIVQCERLQEPREMLLLCRDMQRIEQLRLSALPDVTALGAILSLRALKQLQFFWYDNTEFEALLLAILQNNFRCPTSLKFEQERVYLENATQERLTRRQNAEMREKVTIQAPVWQLSEAVFQSVWNFKNLSKIRCVYCRPFSQAQILELPVRCTNLERFELFGCRDAATDKTLARIWPIPLRRQKCALSIDGIITAQEMMRLRETKNLAFQQTKKTERTGRVLRSIECRFD